MRSLLIALKDLKDHGIIHRDIKHCNFLYSIENHKGLLIDFGQSEYIDNPKIIINEKKREYLIKIKELQSRMHILSKVGTHSFIAPEILFKQEIQDFQQDIFSAGVLLLSLLAKRHPVLSYAKVDKNQFEQKNFVLNQLLPLLYIFGSNYVTSECFKFGYGLYIPQNFPVREPIDLRSLVRIKNYNDSAINLLKRMLLFDPKERITVEEALNHSFFSDIL